MKIFLIALGTMAAVLALYQFWFFAQILYWAKHNPDTTRFMERRLEDLRKHNPKLALKRQWVNYADISINLKRAVIAAEDAKFMDHEGFDWQGIQQAMEKNRRRGKIVAGGSTITQQLAKNLFLSGERSGFRKGEEAIITAMLEAVMDKRRIFELYLNVAEWGEGVFGAQAAARHYFDIDAVAISPEQAARLAAMLPRPAYYDRNPNSPYLMQYSDIIFSRMPDSLVP